MTENIQDTLNARGTKHGNFSDNARIAQRLKAELAAQPNWERMKHYQREALEMICHKIARIMAGDFNYDDHYRDIAGYAQLVVNILNKDTSPAAEVLPSAVAAELLENLRKVGSDPKSTTLERPTACCSRCFSVYNVENLTLGLCPKCHDMQQNSKPFHF